MELLTTDQAAEWLQVHTGTLRNWRCQGRGPAYVRAEGAVRYQRAEVERWLSLSR